MKTIKNFFANLWSKYKKFCDELQMNKCRCVPSNDALGIDKSSKKEN